MGINYGYCLKKTIRNGLLMVSSINVSLEEKGESKEPIDYFYYQLPRILESGTEALFCLQEPGDTIFVPGGWWHAVLNVTDTMAVTQNYMNSINFDNVWRNTRMTRRMFSEYFLKNMRKKNPVLYYRARMLNIKDNFVMYNDRTGRNFVEDFSTTTIESELSETSNESDYKSNDNGSEVISDSDSNSDQSNDISEGSSEGV